MARKPTGNPVGAPEKPINWELFEQLCGLQCTQSEIAACLKVHRETLSRRTEEHYGEDYSTIYKRYSETGYCSLRRHQFVLSKKNAAMAIWLGKNWLGQKENVSELKDLVVHELRAGIKQISEESGSQAIEQPRMEAQSFISHSGS